jgi:hypothetical protein
VSEGDDHVSSVLLGSDIFPGHKLPSQSACGPYYPVGGLRSPGGMIRLASASKAFSEILLRRLAYGGARRATGPQCVSLLQHGRVPRAARRRWARRGGSHRARHDLFRPRHESLWRGGLGSLVLTGAAIRHQDKATRDLIRHAFERCAGVYKSANGLNLPVAFKVGSGRQPA